MSHCPTCQRPCRPGFCDECLQPLGSQPHGRFEALLAREFVPLSQSPPVDPTGPDLSRLHYRRPGWFRRRLAPALRHLALVACLLALVFGGFSAFRAYRTRQANQRAQQHLQQSLQAQASQQWDQSFTQAEAGLVDAAEAHDPALTGQLHVLAGRAAYQQRRWDQATRHLYQAKTLHPEVEAEWKRSLQSLNKQKRAEAEALLGKARQQIVAHDEAGALQTVARAKDMLEAHLASPRQLAEAHYLNGRIFQRMGLVQQACEHLRQALSFWPAHPQARPLLAQLEVRPSPSPSTSPPPAVRSYTGKDTTPEVIIPRLDTGPGYPTYQPPDDDDDRRLSSTDRDRDRRSSSTRRKRSSSSR